MHFLLGQCPEWTHLASPRVDSTHEAGICGSNTGTLRFTRDVILSGVPHANIWSWCWQDNTQALHNDANRITARSRSRETSSTERWAHARTHTHGLGTTLWKTCSPIITRTPKSATAWENNCPRLHNWPVFQGLTLQFVIRLRLLLKLLPDLEVGNYPRFGLHTRGGQLLGGGRKKVKPLRKADGRYLCRRTSLSTNPLSLRAASVRAREHCSPAPPPTQRCRRPPGAGETTPPRMHRGCQCQPISDWLGRPRRFLRSLVCDHSEKAIKFHFLHYFLCNANSC